MVPNGWEIKKLDQIATITSGGTPSRNVPEYWEPAVIPWIRTTEVQNCYLYPHDVNEYISMEGQQNSSAKLIPENSILMAMIGQGKTRGQVALTKFETTINQNCAAIILKRDNAPEFYYQYFLSQYEKIRQSSNSAGQSNLSGGLIKKFKVPIPPFKEQQKMAKILSTWDKAIDATEKLISNSQTQKRALMQQLLTGKKRLLDENGERFSGKWKKHKLKDISSTITGLSGKTKNDFGTGNPFITYMNIYSNSGLKNLDSCQLVNVSENENQTTVQKGDVFFTTSSETPQEVGLSSVLLISPQKDTYLNSFCFGIRLNNESYLLPEFSQFLFRSETSRRKISILAQGSTRFNLSKNNFMNLFFEIPLLNEQKKIASVLSNATQEIELLEKKLEYLKEEKKALMQQLLTGKRRVKVNN